MAPGIDSPAPVYAPFFNEPLHQPDWTKVDQVREEMTKRHGVQPDSTPLIREMRDGPLSGDLSSLTLHSL